MGGAEEGEPPSKRSKVVGESRDLLNSTFLRDSMVRPLGDDEILGTKGIVKKAEFVRVIAEALHSLGYNMTGAHLEEESGIPFQSPLVNLFMKQILDGRWDESVATLHKIDLVDEKIVKLASFVILEQKFFELLDRERVSDALDTLRSDIVPLCINDDRVTELSMCLILPPSQQVKPRAKLLEELQRLFPPNIMIPEKRLIHLVEQALESQLDACRFHNSSVGEMSLLTDHQCGRDQIPSQTLQILPHKDEVWFVQFSHDGKYLASACADFSVTIWELKLDGTFCLKHRLFGHQKPVSFISWSPDDRQLLTCGEEEVVVRWDMDAGDCVHVYMKNGLGLISCGWAPNGKRIYCGVSDKSISMWNLEGKELECWKGNRTTRITDLGISSDGKLMVSVYKDKKLLLFGLESKEKRKIQEDQIITSFSLSDDNRYILLSLWNQEIHLWNIEGSARLDAKYKGHKRTRFTVRSCFGGLNQAFVASGSEDSQVYVWHRASGELVGTLPGHSGTVNDVSWNPAHPHMLASGSDDGTVRIWSSNCVNMKHSSSSAAVGNGVHYCNGGN